MADAQNSSKRKGLTRGKAILIAVLAVVLVVIVYVQFGSRGSAAKPESAGYRPPRRPATTHSAESAAKSAIVTNGKSSSGKDMVAAPVINPTSWKSPDLAAVIAYDPFALPAKFPQPGKVATGNSAGAEGATAAAAADDATKLAQAVEKLRLELKQLEERGVHVIIRERDQYAAMIGDRTLHVGDEINGFTVTAIDPSGVSVERKKSP